MRRCRQVSRLNQVWMQQVGLVRVDLLIKLKMKAKADRSRIDRPQLGSRRFSCDSISWCLFRVDAKYQQKLLVGQFQADGQAEYLINARDRPSCDVRQRCMGNVVVRVPLGISDRATEVLYIAGFDETLFE